MNGAYKYRRCFSDAEIVVCRYCGYQGEVQYMEVDHILPKSRGGKDKQENFGWSCERCNGAKASLTEDMFLQKATANYMLCRCEMDRWKRIQRAISIRLKGVDENS